MSNSMDTSSETDSHEPLRRHRLRGRDAHRRPARDGVGAGVGVADGCAGDISEKISTLASTLQDASRNLTKVDKMLGHYREQTDDKVDSMALHRGNLEDSLSQRLSRCNGARSASASTLHTSDLEQCSGSDCQRFYPTSPLKSTAGKAGRTRRSQSASVHFKNAGVFGEDVHTLHQSLRDLHCDQQRLSADLDREILRRNRSDIDTRRAMESLAVHMTTSQRQDSVSSHVERRLHEMEREMRSEQRSMERERRPDQWAAMSDNVQTLGRHKIQTQERDDTTATARLLIAERERSKMEQELERARRLLEQSEDSRETLAHQVEDMRGELLRARKEKTELQRRHTETPHPHGNYGEREPGRGGPRGQDRSDLEKEVAELRVQLCKASVQSEVEELRRALDRKEKERAQLGLQVEELSSDLAQQEQQRLQMLEQMMEIKRRGQAERRESEALLQANTRNREELKTRAQEAVRQWRAKCKRLQKELEESKTQVHFHADKASQAAREKESSQAQLKALSQQNEAARRELGEILGRLAQREEELHRKGVELSETCQRQLSLEQELKEAKESSAALQEENRRQADIQARLKEENQRLEERVDTQVRRCQRDQSVHVELQAALNQMTTANAQLAQRLADEERAKNEHQKAALELQSKLTGVQEERTALGQQLQLERDVHQKELENMKATIESSRSKKERELQDMLRHCNQERTEIQACLKEVKAEAASDKELCEALRSKVDRMKDECDKLAAQLSAKEDAYTILLKKYQLLKQELDGNVRSGEQRRALESEVLQLEEKVLQIEAEQEAVLTSMGNEVDAACHSLARNGGDTLQAISQKPGLVKDAHRWLAETKTKLRWLCEEVQERDMREQRLRKQHQQTKDQLKALRQSQDLDQAALLQRLDQQEKLLHSLSTEKKELLERSRRKDEEMRNLQDRVLDLQMNTQEALDHLEAIPEKQCLLENFKDLEESQRQREVAEKRYAKYKEIVWNLQHQLDESKRKIHECRDEKVDTTSRGLRLAAVSSSIIGSSTFLSNSVRSDTLSPQRRLTTSDLDDAAFNGVQLFTEESQ